MKKKGKEKKRKRGQKYALKCFTERETVWLTFG